jgi:hypothetical protein
MTTFESLELGINEIHEVAYTLKIRHKYNQAYIDALLGG